MRDFIAADLEEQGQRNLLASMEPGPLRENLAKGFDVNLAVVGKGPGERIVGVVATRDDTHLFHLFVARDWHRRGIARQLWDVARRRCIERAGTSRFTVFASKYAQGAYRRLGFRSSGAPDVRGGVVSYPMELRLD